MELAPAPLHDLTQHVNCGRGQSIKFVRLPEKLLCAVGEIVATNSKS
jgi:hypothetical protein